MEPGTRTPVVRYSPHGAVASAALSPDGRFVATGSWDHSAKIWDAESGRAIRKLDGGHTGYVNAVEFSPTTAHATELLTASDDGTARLWNVETGKPTGVIFRGHTAGSPPPLFRPTARACSRSAATRPREFGTALLGRKSGHSPVTSGPFCAASSRPMASASSPAARTTPP